MIAAIDWVVQHRQANGLNIRVLNLAFGTDSGQDYRSDPLAYAVEVAWSKGIVVVVSAGNSGGAGLTDPAYDPFVIAVGAADTTGAGEGGSGATVPDWSSRGDGARNPDVVAPGVGIVSLRAPGSFIDEEYPGARVSWPPRGEQAPAAESTQEPGAEPSGDPPAEPTEDPPAEPTVEQEAPVIAPTQGSGAEPSTDPPAETRDEPAEPAADQPAEPPPAEPPLDPPVELPRSIRRWRSPRPSLLRSPPQSRSRRPGSSAAAARRRRPRSSRAWWRSCSRSGAG